MADSVSDNFAIANGIAAYALVRELIEYLEALGVPRGKVIGITMNAHDGVKELAKAKAHPALPIAAELLQDAVRQLEASSPAKH